MMKDTLVSLWLLLQHPYTEYRRRLALLVR